MYQGKFKLKNPSKYIGNYNNVFYRSSWELSLMMWFDNNSSIIEWSSEELVIIYLCATDNKEHRYFVDFTFKTKSGENYWIEVKPKKYTVPPEKPKKATKRYIKESLEFVKNQCKWKAANKLAMTRNATFMVWTEDTLKSMGIKLIT
jgi:hypothetical protein